MKHLLLLICLVALFQPVFSHEKQKPIPLTEEWLVKFGFKNWGDKYTFGLKGINIHKRQRGFVLRKSVPIIKYAHQLQNLYFALTGEELTLKSVENEQN